jgi:cardiolipin synthase
MKTNKSISVVLATILTVSILTPPKSYSAGEAAPAPPSKFSIGYIGQIFGDLSNQVKVKFTQLVDAVSGYDLFDIPLLDRSVLNIFDLNLVDRVFDTVSDEVESGLKELIAIWASKDYIINPSSQLGVIKNAKDQSVILDLAEKDLTMVENQILNLLISLHGEGKMIPFVSTLIETLKKDPKFGTFVSSITPDEKLLLLSTIDATIASTASLRKFSHQTWTELSDKLELNLNLIEKDSKNPSRLSDAHYLTEFADLANAEFYPTQASRLLVDGPASFTLRNASMKSAKSSINMITWAVVDDKTGQELADLLIAKTKENIAVRLIVDGKVSYTKGYKEQVLRMEKNGVQVVRWSNPQASFMGQHRKILIVDDLTIMGGMNPGDAYSHKAGEPKNLWRDTDVAFEGDSVEQTQKLFATLWNKQITDQNLSFSKITKIKKTTSTKSDGRAMIIEHQPSGKSDQHEILLATMKAIRGAEKTVDIENAYVVVFPSLLSEIQAAVDRGVRVRILTNSTDSVDEPVVALPILRSAKKLADIGAEVYMRKGSTVHSKFMIVDERLFLIGSYNLHPRSETIEGETIVVFDHKPLAEAATKAFENDVLPKNATLLEKSTEINLPINGSTLLPLRMFYDQL